MFVVEVIPLTRGSAIESLSYYSATSYSPGTIISVPIRSKEVPAMVTVSRSVSAAKTAVRAATFSLRKLPEQSAGQTLPQSLIETAKELQKKYPAELGAILFALLPSEIRDGTHMLEHTVPCSHSDILPEIEVMQATFDDRYISYRSKIREVFAHRGSVLFVVPTSSDIERADEMLSQGIEDRVVVFSPLSTKKKSQAAHDSFYNLTNAKLIITTPSHAYLDRHDITHIIIEQSRSRHYKSKIRPYIDHRDALTALAQVTNRTITMGDILPRSEEELARREERYTTLGEHPKRISLDAKLEIIEQDTTLSPERGFELFAPETIAQIEKTISTRKNIFIFAARRGLAPVVACRDCGFIFRCPDSGAPYTLFKTNRNGEEERWFLSQTSGKRVRASDTCQSCGSWRLGERGIGIQYIQRELSQKLPKVPVMLFDHTTATTYKKARTIIGRFYDTKGAILLGTQMALPHIEKPVDLSIITSHDATRAIPSWRAEEEFMGLLLTIRELTNDKVLLQTRTTPDELLTLAKQGAVEHFYNDELELREALGYPPFTHFVLLSWQDTKDGAMKTEEGLADLLKDYKPRFYSAPYSLIKKTKRYGLIRIKREKWPHAALMEILRQLPPSIKIEINPDRIV